MKTQNSLTTPAIATWELWAAANMLISTHGTEAEQHAQDQLAEAIAQQDEGGEIVWRGIITQLAKNRGASS